MLERGEIDLLFDAEELGDEGIRKRAASGKYALLGLDDVDGLVVGQQNFKPRTIKKSAYAYGTEFCNSDLQTISTRRIIICPSSMSKTDAYYLTDGIRGALRQTIPTVQWDKEDAPPVGTGLICQLHEGANDFRQNHPPWWWRMILDNWLIALTAVGGFLGFILKQWVRNKDPLMLLNKADLTISKNTQVGPLEFQVDDAESRPEELTVSVSTDNPKLFPVSNLVTGGKGRNRTITLSPALDQIGAALVSVQLTDPDGGKTINTFKVHVVESTPVLPAPLVAAPIADGKPVEDNAARPVILDELSQEVAAIKEIDFDLPQDAPRRRVQTLTNRVERVQEKIRTVRPLIGSTHADVLDACSDELRRINNELARRLSPGQPPTPAVPDIPQAN